MTPAKVLWALVVCDAALFVATDVAATMWAERRQWPYFVATIVLAMAGYAVFAYVLRCEMSLSVTTCLVSVIAILGSVFAGVCFFGDAFEMRHAFGIAMALAAVWLLH